ncbi:MAG: ATPase, partial [Lysobacteraceae bacterium]
MSELLDLVALIRADTPLLVIETPDEARVMELFRQSLMHAWRALYRWSVTEGLRRVDLDREDESELAPDLSATLNAMRDAGQRGVYVLLDATPYLGYASYQRALRDIIQRRGCQPHVVVLVGTKVELPEVLEPFAVRFPLRLPDANALLRLVREEAHDYATGNGGRRVEANADAVLQIVRNLQGLTLTDARRITRHLVWRDGA